ncbi:hypothetical protein HWB57_gp030 [Erwinia phage vB_EamM-Bue1]|uniref:Uncharacterized protein n=1 Tax=Erwinia phage vB_EamM-Bue1 TaxID=2099338 RepID=A0A2P1JU67_9CAUD|nr:hypothetical protein HWB57_gp030 [Erwinia phage vB_EamM-Bue1]AVO22873.1 hypothetical protein [Erwinia phage vB_EamM-Bue1]
MSQQFFEMLKDKEAVEGVSEWLKSQEQTVNVGQVQGDFDEHIESSTGWLLRLLQSAPKQLEWADHLAISEAPSVDECIRNFLEDQTEDNAVCMIREIIEQAAKHASK